MSTETTHYLNAVACPSCARLTAEIGALRNEKILVREVRKVQAERDRALALLRKTRTHAPLGTHRWATLLAEIDAFLGEKPHEG